MRGAPGKEDLRSLTCEGTRYRTADRAKPEFEQEEERAGREARTVAAFLEGGPPDFLMEAMLAALDDAFKHFEMIRPLTAEGGELADFDKQNLRPLFMKTALVSWSDMWAGNERLATAISDILEMEETPQELFDAVADFVCNAPSRARGFWTVEIRRGACFAQESFVRLLVGDRISRKKLDRDLAIELRVFRQIHFSHPARAYARQYPVMRNSCACNRERFFH